MNAHMWTRATQFDPLPHLSRRAECASDVYEHETISETPLWKSLTFHHFGLIISATFGTIAVVVAFFLIVRHATHYLKPYEQKHIIRILVMIPIYAVVSFLSYLYYKNAIYFEVVRDCYEAFAIASFFTLMCHYIAPNLHEQKEYFRNVQPKNWVWPITWMQKCSGGEDKGWLRKPRSGLTWFNVVWISIFQYCFIRPFFTIVAVVAQTQGRYCSSSKDPRYAYIWVAGFEAVSVTIAMYCVIQFYIQLKEDLAPHRPFLKVLCIKLVIFFCFWQSWIISLLTAEGGPLKATAQIAGPDLRIGIPSMLTCVEMAIFALLHVFAFPWKPYDLKYQSPLDTTIDGYSAQPTKYASGPARALLDALNPWDIIKACGRGFRWLFYGARHRTKDSSYQTKLEPVATNTSYNGPTFAGNGEPVNAPINAPAPTKKNEGSGDSDTIGLLDDAQANPYVHQDSNSYDSAYGPGADVYGSPPNPDRLPQAPTPGQEYGVAHHGHGDGRFQNFEEQDTTYHGGAAANSYYGRPRYYQEENTVRPSTEWDMFAGATRPAQRPQGDGKKPSEWI
ncbi:DUF300-domain-containing protein [Didymella exigua CBS 183.55]|uniref:DUF300-domain-containing protein n=1 Tax=Didymella exigua CBS 183.55 TaxID=1150837 RepID=A0A6A5RK91_9PLEO|nr:DUF300-domain-containing protein [Didymella exigua CBS 183.55]KAF1927384.1 DUF300-domain-containing protein [Didymella exigua CBS 183.55]